VSALAPGQADLRKENKGKTALEIVSSIKVVKRSEPTADGDTLDIKIGWYIGEWNITSTEFRV
tara:strand:- start:378 stop:566 length:189 start_codon:yes stop_codon:yes gene_type:complete